MPSPVTINVKCEPYLIRFLETYFNCQGPIVFPKANKFIEIIDYFLEIPPLDFVEKEHGDHTLRIQLPYLEEKNVKSYRYLPPYGEKFLVKQIHLFFKITFRLEISKCIALGFQRKDSIEIFMNKYNLPQDIWDMLEKDYQRFLKVKSKTRKNKLFRTNKNLSDSAEKMQPTEVAG